MCENMIWGHAPPTKKAKETSWSPTAETLDRSQDMDRTHVITNPITVIVLLFINNSFPLLNNCFINSYNKKTTCKNTNNKLIHHRITWGLLVLSNSTWFNDLIWYIYICNMKQTRVMEGGISLTFWKILRQAIDAIFSEELDYIAG